MKILIIEDEEEMLQNMRDFLKKENFVVETADSVMKAREKIGVYNYDCILLDINLKDGSGFSLLKELK